jgi:hypothetical protein
MEKLSLAAPLPPLLQSSPSAPPSLPSESPSAPVSPPPSSSKSKPPVTARTFGRRPATPVPDVATPPDPTPRGSPSFTKINTSLSGPVNDHFIVVNDSKALPLTITFIDSIRFNVAYPGISRRLKFEEDHDFAPFSDIILSPGSNVVLVTPVPGILSVEPA